MTTGTTPIQLSPDPSFEHMIGQGHIVGNLVFLSGQASINQQREIVGIGDIDAQITQAMANVERALTAAGSGIDRIFKITIYLTDMAYFDRVLAMRKRYFAAPWPSDTTVGVTSLALEGLLVELDVIATTYENATIA
jgi:enamine deaminase RidA (YjgF/YER057c/UK114 family)